MQSYQACASVSSLRPSDRRFPNHFPIRCLCLLASLCLVGPLVAHSQQTGPALVTSVAPETPPLLEAASLAEAPTPAQAPFNSIRLVDPVFMGDGGSSKKNGKPSKRPEQSEIIVEGLASYGNYKIFASGFDCKLYTAGVEYDRHTWGYFLKARFDYVAEVLPFVLLDAPAKADMWGNPESKARKLVPGIGFSPIGFRWMWRPNRAIRPYLEAKGGGLIFSQKVLSPSATYENFSLQSAGGVQVMMTPRLGLRLGLFSDFHFSNGFIHDSNPGLDVMSANLGVSWHFHDE